MNFDSKVLHDQRQRMKTIEEHQRTILLQNEAWGEGWDEDFTAATAILLPFSESTQKSTEKMMRSMTNWMDARYPKSKGDQLQLGGLFGELRLVVIAASDQCSSSLYMSSPSLSARSLAGVPHGAGH
jgi:hypothetical protein